MASLAASSLVETFLVQPTSLSQLDLQVIALAKSETDEGEKRPFLRRLLVGDRRPRLANPRLEALRRFAARSWTGATIYPSAMVNELVDAGYQIDEVMRAIDAQRGSVTA